jgi:HEPN domain-containing protein
MTKLTRQWIRKAESDLRAARKLAELRPPAHDEVCFHCQQAAEKYLKALMQEWGIAIPKIHALTPLLNALMIQDPALRSLRRGLNRLASYAVEYRYPGAHADGRKAATALRQAKRVRVEVRIRLGLPASETA